MLTEDVLYLTVAELGAQIKSGQVSPVELTESYLERSKRIGPRLNAYVTFTDELARQQAKAAEAELKSGTYRGPLHGIPYAAKDLLAVKGYPTTWGARPYANQRFDYNATVIDKLTEAGAVLIGKAAMIELAGGMGYRYASAALTGPCKNPWNTAYWTCGSSSGSGAIVAAGLAAFAIGTETWGSIVCPSGFCGVSGLRPTFGMVSRYGAMALSYSMDKIGPMCRSAEDCAIVFEAIRGYDPKDLGSTRGANQRFSFPSQLPKIGWLTNQWAKPMPSVAAAAGQAIGVLKNNGVQVMDVALPEGPWESAAGMVISAEGASAFEDLIASGRVAELVDPLGKIAGYVSQQIAATDLIRAQRVRNVLQSKMEELFGGTPVLACASQPVTASPIEANLETDLSFADPIGGIGNLCGLPATSVPCGFDEKGLPTGIQFIGRPGGEGDVIAVARAFQATTQWHRKHPTM
jgi:Asp-tRNA(Asn)/Glu-tRNA(Gln) amidotransferase A subunit family amidase